MRFEPIGHPKLPDCIIWLKRGVGKSGYMRSSMCECVRCILLVLPGNPVYGLVVTDSKEDVAYNGEGFVEVAGTRMTRRPRAQCGVSMHCGALPAGDFDCEVISKHARLWKCVEKKVEVR